MIRHLSLLGFLAACSSDYDVKSSNETYGAGGFPEIDSGTPIEEADEAEEPDPEVETPAPEFEAPTAECSVEPEIVRPIREEATWVGSESTDPAELDLTYDWKLIDRPVGSTANMPSGDADRPEFIADLAGDYVAELTVTNSEGVTSSPCETTLTAEPVEALWVEMFWESPNDDMDLHLLAPGGSIETDTDCYFANCTPTSWTTLDWGVFGDVSDDPSLDLDDIDDSGPENINIESPQDAVYTVLVHDYPGSVFAPGNPVTVNIYLNGSLQWSETRVISGEDTYTTFATIDVSTSTITSM